MPRYAEDNPRFDRDARDTRPNEYVDIKVSYDVNLGGHHDNERLQCRLFLYDLELPAGSHPVWNKTKALTREPVRSSHNSRRGTLSWRFEMYLDAELYPPGKYRFVAEILRPTEDYSIIIETKKGKRFEIFQ